MRVGAFAILVAFGLGGNACLAGGFHPPWTETARFVSAPDGDTVKVETSLRGQVNVRVAGIDTPERGQGYWRAARSHLVEAASEGELQITCYKTDQYNREVCRIKTRAGDLGASLLRAGLAWHFKRFEDEQAPEERALYTKLEQKAQADRIGLWAEADPMPPDVCRKARRAREKCR